MKVYSFFKLLDTLSVVLLIGYWLSTIVFHAYVPPMLRRSMIIGWGILFVAARIYFYRNKHRLK